MTALVFGLQSPVDGFLLLLTDDQRLTTSDSSGRRPRA